VNLLVCYSLQALGIAGRDNAAATLQALKKKSRHYLYDYGSSVAQAAYNLHMQKTLGDQLFRQKYSELSRHATFQQWATGTGRDWVEWANNTRRGKRPEG
jgi:hypothetical protein